MPTYTIESPSGDEYEIEAPEGATKDQAFEFFKREHAAGRVQPKQKLQKTSLADDFISGAKATGAAVGDFAGGMLKIPASALLAVGGKLADPSLDLQKHYEAAQQAVEDTYPSLGSALGVDKNIGYTAPLKPFELYGKGVGAVAKKAGELTGSQDVEGAINLGANFLPIPFAGKAGRAVSKVLGNLDPTLRSSGKPKPASKDISSVEKSIDSVKAGETAPAQIPYFVTDENGVNIPYNQIEAVKAAKEAQRRAALDQRDSGAAAFQNIADTQLEGWNESWPREPVKEGPNGISAMVDQLEAARAAEAQKAIELRQQALEEQVKRQQALDFNAAERARQEQAPTGYQQWAENMREQPVRQEGPGPIAFEETPPAPYSLTEAPFQPDRQLDPTQFLAEQQSLPIVKSGEIRDAWQQRNAERQLELDKQGQLEDRQAALEDRLQPVEEQLREQAHAAPDNEQLRLERGRPVKSGTQSFYGKRGRQAGAIDTEIFTDIAKQAQAGFQKLKTLTADSMEIKSALAAMAKQNKEDLVKNILGENSGYVDNIKTPEQAIAASLNAKDISGLQRNAAKSVSPGLNHMVIKTNNPVLKLLRNFTRDVFLERNRLTEQYITGKDGIGSTIKKMSPQEKAEVVQLLQLGDRKQFQITPEIMDKHGFSETQKEFVRKFYEMDTRKLDIWNQKREEAGMSLVKAREGHVPGIFNGDFKQLVLDKDNNVLGVISADFKWQLKAAQDAMQKKYPNAKFTNVKRSDLGGSGARAKNFADEIQILNLLAEHDEAFAKVRDDINSAISSKADDAYGAAQHALRKRGVEGNAGNKSWLSPEKNADEFIKAYLNHWEQQIGGHLALPVEQQMRAVFDNKATEHMSNAKDYADMYLRSMGGDGVGKTGGILNALIDTPARLAGIGPSGSREVVNQFNKRMGQWTMGFGNYLFSFAQFLQVLQTGVPEITAAAKQLGVNQVNVIPSMGKAIIDWGKYALGMDVPGHYVEDLQAARNMGLLTFSEFEDVHKVTQSEASRKFDKVVDFSRSTLGEKPTRPLVFLTAVNMLRDSGLPKDQLYRTAYNITQAGMFDYSSAEKPLAYQRLGVAGQMVGTLRTYQHGYMGQLARLAGNATKDPFSAVYAVTAALAVAGITGIPFYDDADAVVKKLTGMAGKPQSIADLTMENMPRWGKSGVLSDVLNVNMQGKMSSSNVIPDSLPELASPWFSKVGKIATSVADYLDTGTTQSRNALAMQFVPEGPLKGLAERQLTTDPEGFVLDNKGMRGNERTDWDKNVRLYSGGRSMDEADLSKRQFDQTQRERWYKDKQKNVLTRMKDKLATGEASQEDMRALMAEYSNAKGDPEEAVNQLIQYMQTRKFTKQQRLQGIPSGTLSSLYKFSNYQE